MGTLGGLYVILVLLAVVLAVVWILMPLAVIGVKPLLRDILRELQKLNSGDRPGS